MDSALKPVLVALVVGAIALVSVWTGQPLLMPSLASAAFSQILAPRDAASRAYNSAVGQLAGLAGGFAGAWIFGVAVAPAFAHHNPLLYGRAAAAAAAVAIAAMLQLATRATNPAGGATAAVVALGTEYATAAAALRIAVGIVLVTILGEAARMVVLRLTSKA
jgi:hypothetical protein